MTRGSDSEIFKWYLDVGHSGLKGETPEKKCLRQSVNGFFHQNIYWFWKALTQNPRVGSFLINPTKWCKKNLKIEF